MTYKPYDLAKMRSELSRDEGRKPRLYQDSVGKWTVGVGFNLSDRDLPEHVIDILLDDEIDTAERILDKVIPQWRLCNAVRQRALLNMAFNLGESRLSGFKDMLKAVRNAIQTGGSDWYEQAAKEALDSQWAKQVGQRATRIAEMIRTGSGA